MIASVKNNGHMAVRAVYLDGVKVECCIFADTVKGEVIVHRRDANGMYVIEGDSFVNDTLTGVVTLDIDPAYAYCPTSESFEPTRRV